MGKKVGENKHFQDQGDGWGNKGEKKDKKHKHKALLQ